MRITFLLLLAGLCGLSTSAAPAADPPAKVKREKVDPLKTRELMHKKLEHAQQILGAITLNKLDKSAEHARELIKLSQAAEWTLFKTPSYEMYSDDFRRSAEALVKMAKDKNLDGAKLAYLEMTMNCFHCHGYVRDVGMISLDGWSP